MALNKIYKNGDALLLTVTAGMLSGAPVAIGNLTGVLVTDADAVLNQAVIDTEGVYDLSVAAIKDGPANEAVAIGDAIYFNTGDTPKLNKKTAGVFFGYALEAISSGLTATIYVKLMNESGASTIANLAVSTAKLANSAVTTAKIADVNVTMAKLSDAKINVSIPLGAAGAISATSLMTVMAARQKLVLVNADIVTKNQVAANDTNYWTFSLKNKGQAGAGTDEMAAGNTTVATGANMEAYIPFALTIDVAKDDVVTGDVIHITSTKSASATALAEAVLSLTFEKVD